jgi:FHS family L-fucose permease-like MFS transporter
MAILGPPETSHSRLTGAQFFNSFGTFIGPFVGAALILSGGVEGPDPESAAPEVLAQLRRQEAAEVQTPFLMIAGGLLVLAVLFWLLRRWAAAPRADRPASFGSTVALLRRPRLALGALSIFIYVGAEVSIGSIMVNYLMEPRTLGASAEAAGRLVAFYWGGAMVGRLIGTFVLRSVAPGLVLAGCAVGAATLAVVSAFTSGETAGYAVIAIGLFNSIMFPTIFTIAIEGLGDETPQGSGLLCMAIVGGAIIPVLTGLLADNVGLALALLLPAACYLWIAAYGLMSRRSATQAEPVPTVAPPAGG